MEKNCLTCGKLFTVKPSLDRVKHCSMRCAKIGKSSPNKGKVTPAHVRAKQSAAKLGKYVGENSWNWKGGKTSQDKTERIKFRRTMQSLVFERDNFTCQVCFQYSGYLQVDHIKKWRDYPELRFELDNCRTLCMACHYYITFKRKMPEGTIWGHSLKKGITL